jgi:hypothetical protein
VHVHSSVWGWLFAPIWRLGWLLWWCCAGLCGLLFGGVWLLLPDASWNSSVRLLHWQRCTAAAAGIRSSSGSRQLAVGCAGSGDDDALAGAGWLEGGPAMVLVEAPAGFDEVIERDVMTSATVE